jgi:N-acetylglucosamine kinase-like BadF-type ATPase
MKKHVLGLDGGGTKTRVVIMDDEGEICGVGVGGPSNFDDIGIEAAKKNIGKTVDQACREAGLSAGSFSAAFLGIGGVSSDADREIVRNIAVDLNLAPEVHIGVDHDIRIALTGGLSGRSGIVQIAGTGSSTYGRNSAGNSWRSGGWGPLISDEGSGYWLGIQAMKAATRASDGRSPFTTLTASVLASLQLSNIEDIYTRIYVEELSRSEIAALGPLVIEAAKKGDGVSLEILERGVQSMAECVFVVAEHLGFVNECELALTGGVFRAGELVVDLFHKAVRARLPQCRIVMAELPPVLGACLLALRFLDIRLSPKQMRSLRQKASMSL